MANGKLRWAVIGVGKHAPTRGGASAIAYAHAEAIRRNADRFELVAASARTPRSLEDFAREYPCRTYADFAELLAKERPDGVALCTYAPDRESHVKAILAAGVKNILIEKPLALSLEAATRMKDAADQAGARLFVNFQRRYGKPFAFVRDAIREGRLGAIRTIELLQPCSNAMDFGPHFINMALYFLGDAVEADSVVAGADGMDEIAWQGTQVERRLTATFFLKGGVKVLFSAAPEITWQETAVRVVGERGYAELWADRVGDMKSVVRVVTDAGVENPPMDENFHHGDADKFLYFERAYRDMGEAIADKKPCRIDFEHGFATQRLLLGAYAAARTAKRITFACLAALAVPFAGMAATNYLLPDAEAERIAREKLSLMTLEEKVSLCGLSATMYLNAIPRVGIDREWSFNDCGHCMKPEHNRDRWGYVSGVDDRSTSLPCPSALAATWNAALATKHGDVMGSQMRARDKSQMLGPGINIMRNPLCGRNWEYMSEDPLVVSRMVVPLIRAAQAHGLTCTPKHFCLNSQELNRFDTCSTVDDRALHEIYLPAFEAVVRDAGVLSLMTAYNRYNGTFCSENAYLQKALLREQWGFRGTIVTDWGGQHSCDNAVMNGGGIEANCGKDVYWLTDFYGHAGKDKFPLATAVKEGRIPATAVDTAALRVLYVMAKTGFLTKHQDKGERLTAAHQQVAREIGDEAIVLAKNAKGVLPLDKSRTKNIVVFGQIADLEQAQLGSSCECHVLYEITFLKGLREYLGDACDITLYPLGDEASDGHVKGIDHLILETFDPTSPDAFAARAWVKKIGKNVSYDKETVLKVGEAQAGDTIEWSSSLVAPESGTYIFGAEATDCAKTEILVGGNAEARPTLERGKSYTVTFRVQANGPKSACAFGWILPSAQRPDWDVIRKNCQAADAVLVFTGTTMGFGQAHETEGEDRPNMATRTGHDDEIARILAWHLPRTVVVCRTGSALELPWVDACDTLLIASYLGQEAGRPMARTLFGAVNPSAKLTYSWPKRYADTPTGHYGARAYNATNAVYLEGIYVGYRWYEKRGIAVDFPFGHGLSYTRFTYGDVRVAKPEGAEDRWQISVPITNAGERDGGEVVQFYVAAKNARVDRPIKELKGFAKVFVKRGETAVASVTFTPRDFAYFDTLTSRFRTDPGDYEILVGSSSADIRTRATLTVTTRRKVPASM